MVLWVDFLRPSLRPAHQVMRTTALGLANKLAPGTIDEFPRVEPLIDGVPLPPKDPPSHGARRTGWGWRPPRPTLARTPTTPTAIETSDEPAVSRALRARPIFARPT